MKRTLKILVAPCITLLLVVVLFILLVTIHPFSPDNPFFTIQNAAEYSRIQLVFSPEKRVDRCFDLIERRLEELSRLDQMDAVGPTLDAFDHSITFAIKSIQALPWEEASIYYHNVQPLMRRVERAVDEVNDRLPHAHVKFFYQKVSEIKAASTIEEIQQLASQDYLSIQIHEPPAKPVGFEVVRSKKIEKPRMLAEVDERRDCMGCHANGMYMEPDSKCSDCHIRESYFMAKMGTDQYKPKKYEERYPYHFVGDCVNCHSTKSWVIEDYQHTFAYPYTCMVCHENDTPSKIQPLADRVFLTGLNRMSTVSTKDHYPVDCVHCHQNTTTWDLTSFDHQQQICEGCHARDERFIRYPFIEITCMKEQKCQTCHWYDGHHTNYGENCYDCHQNVKSWLPATINHDNFSSCAQCHFIDKPDSHLYRSDCSVCHTSEAWKNLKFDHSNSSDCKSCHSAPTDHLNKGYTEQCSTCHSIYQWEKALFHLILSNCSSCHASPANHYPAACSSCHDTRSWLPAIVNHDGLNACTSCHTVPARHYPAACLSCHDTNSWLNVRVNHLLLTNCTDCHTAPANHYPGSCLSCHTTSSWEPQNYHSDHTIACATCHTAPAGHYPGACENCHKTTSNWSASFDHSTTTLSCSTCHLAPADHWPGECSNCHVTTTWSDVNFDHSGYTDCKSCHTRPKGHPNQQCSNCHTTDTWLIP